MFWNRVLKLGSAGVGRPAHCLSQDGGELRPGDAVVGFKGAVGVAVDGQQTHQVLDVLLGPVRVDILECRQVWICHDCELGKSG